MILNDRQIDEYATKYNMITPYSNTKNKMGNLSWGLGHFGYDIRISGEVKKFKKFSGQLIDPTTDSLTTVEYVTSKLDGCIIQPGEFALVFTLETFDIPDTMVALVKDKSTLARLGIAVQNTILEPGWKGVLTVEITNHGDLDIILREGMPIAQMIFLQGEEPWTVYNGRYQHQKAGTPAIDN